MQVVRCVFLFCSLLTGNAFAASPWGTTWGENFNSVKAKFPDGEVLDTSTADFCKGSTAEHCQQRQVILNRKLVGELPARVIFVFSPEAKLSLVYVHLEKAEKYTPRRLGITYDQIKKLLETEHGKAIGASAFTLVPAPNRVSKNSMYGQATAVWHTKDSIISVDVYVASTESESTPALSGNLFLTYSPLQLIGK